MIVEKHIYQISKYNLPCISGFAVTCNRQLLYMKLCEKPLVSFMHYLIMSL